MNRDILIKQLKKEGDKKTLDILIKILYNIRDSFFNGIVSENDIYEIFKMKGKLIVIEDLINLLEVLLDGNKS